jgi:hypothetical protein
MGDTLLEKGSVLMESVEEVKRKCKGKERRFGKRYGVEVKLRCVKLRLEEEYPLSILSKEFDVSKDTICHWVKAYRERGEAGLRNQIGFPGSRRKLPGPVHDIGPPGRRPVSGQILHIQEFPGTRVQD